MEFYLKIFIGKTQFLKDYNPWIIIDSYKTIFGDSRHSLMEENV